MKKNKCKLSAKFSLFTSIIVIKIFIECSFTNEFCYLDRSRTNKLQIITIVLFLNEISDLTTVKYFCILKYQIGIHFILFLYKKTHFVIKLN